MFTYRRLVLAVAVVCFLSACTGTGEQPLEPESRESDVEVLNSEDEDPQEMILSVDQESEQEIESDTPEEEEALSEEEEVVPAIAEIVEPEPSGSPLAEQAVDEAAPEKVKASTLFSPNTADLVWIAAHDPKDMTYALATQEASETAITFLRDVLGELEVAAPENPPTGPDGRSCGLLAMKDDYSKLEYNLTSDGMEIGGYYYALSPEDYQELETAFQAINNARDVAHAQWLYWLNPNRVVSATMTGLELYRESGLDTIQEIAAAARGTLVRKNSLGTYNGNHEPGAEAVVLRLHFDNDILITIIVEGELIYLESSDISYGCRYTLAAPDTVLENFMAAFEEPGLTDEEA